MTQSLPVCCRARSFELLRQQLPSMDSSDSLLAAASAVAMHALEGVDLGEIDAKIQDYVDQTRSRVRGHQPQALLAHLHQLLFEEQGFEGNTTDYQNPVNSYLPVVLETHRGLPITLSLVYKLIADRLGLQAVGIGLPGHFLAGVCADGRMMLVDPFHRGREVSPAEAHALMERALDKEMDWSDELLAPVTHRQWLTRIIQNLLSAFSSAGQYRDVAAMLELEMLLWPGERGLQRDLALVLARCGLSAPACTWLNSYLSGNPDDPQTEDLKQLLDVLGG
jgi:regulator of sirC expression with transglutaminase-like and TPR domain